ncbi:UDP-N-acetylglucosamine 2-epimerase [Bacillus sp. B190/17]|uniref:UDP-N-acetylglucosamine 2-epimerase n=1 Tax=Bacillus lumedeiriae TaxID=3058829 RepID=A0ABW8ICL4_9BACI
MTKRKICVVTGTRAEYGVLYWLMKEIQADDELELQLVVTGMHLSPEFGLTYKQIEEDGFAIDEKVEMLISGDTPSAIAKSIGLGTIGFSDTFVRLQPDILILLGDRFEILSAAQTALVMRIPVAHISGGELTEGVIDESIRHAITKMSHIHFPANEEYRNRVIQLGEKPSSVFNVGDPGVESIRKMKLLSINELNDFYGMKLSKLFLVTFHPSTLEVQTAEDQMKNLLLALDFFPEYQVIFTKSNADTDGRRINELIDEYTANNTQRVKSFFSLGQLRYLSTLNYSNAVIGNSSSGIIEAPVLSVPTVNIGERQKGRLKASTIIDCIPTVDEIAKSINTAVSEDFQQTLNQVELKYDGFTTSKEIKKVLKNIDVQDIIKKTFYDIS